MLLLLFRRWRPSRPYRSFYYNPAEEHQCDGGHIWSHIGVRGQCKVCVCVCVYSSTQNDLYQTIKTQCCLFVSFRPLLSLIPRLCLSVFPSLPPGLSLSSALHGGKMECWWTEASGTLAAVWPSAVLWSVTAATTNAKPPSGAVAPPLSALEHICTSWVTSCSFLLSKLCKCALYRKFFKVYIIF